MASSISETNILFKKFLGTANAFEAASYAAEAAGSARPKVIASLQVMNQEIPKTAPTDLTTVSAFTPTKGAGTKQVSTAYPYICKYTLTLESMTPGESYRYNNPASSTGDLNLLNNAIPFNYDAGGLTYAVSMTNSAGTVIEAKDATYPWVFDTDAGYVYFIGDKFPDSTTNKPVLTFWRYEGTFGVGSGTGGGDGTTLGKQF